MNNKMGYLIIAIGIGLLLWGIISIKSNTSNTAKPAKKKEQSNTDNKAKGDAFEAYVVKLFNKDFFTLNEWRGDKYVEGNYPVSSHYPDLEVNFNYKKENVNVRFAIECKWRKYYFKNAIKWAEDYQITNYKKFAEKENIAVFVVIGIGGEANTPKDIFIIPLNKLENNTISKEELQKYIRRSATENFFWDIKEKTLK